MPSNRLWIKILCMALACCVVSGCGKLNEQSPELAANGKHPDGWLLGHRSAYHQNPDQCRECHGVDLKGGITKVDCFNQAALGQCHAGGHPPRRLPHQLPFKDAALHGAAAKKDLLSCKSCHGTAGGAGSNPRFNLTIGTLKEGCEDCHKPFMAHPPLAGSTTGWKGHAVAGNMGSSCNLCHGADFLGGVGPGCNKCHTALKPGTIPATSTGSRCNSCHASKPALGSHERHFDALPEGDGICGSCHDGAGNGTDKHNNGVKNVSFAPAYAAKSGGVASRNSDGSCSNISCHGGVTTPAWGGEFTEGCLSCHTAGTLQYNSYNSGKHSLHLETAGLECSDCHDMIRTSGAASHFSGLATPVFELAPAATIKVPGYTSADPSCTPGKMPPSGRYSIGVCHVNETKKYTWTSAGSP